VKLEPELSFQRTIPRQLVHRAAVAEVFITDAAALGDDHFLVGAQWPRDHALYHPDAYGRTDPLLFAETIRQSLVYLAHWHYQIPLAHRFIGRDMELEITDPNALCVGAEPLPVVLTAQWLRLDATSPRRYDARLEVVLSAAGTECGRGSLRGTMVPERQYQLLRRRRGDRPVVPTFTAAAERRVPPALVGRLRAKDSVLAPGASTGEWLLQADPTHAVLFDHATDHLPLMVLLEGFRQLGHLMVHGADSQGGQPPQILTALAAECRVWAELDEPTRLLVREDSRIHESAGRRLCIDAVQQDTVVASRMIWRPLEQATPSEPGQLLSAQPCWP